MTNVLIRIPRTLPIPDANGSFRVTIPMEVARAAGLKGGERIIFEVVDGKMVMSQEGECDETEN